MVTFTVIPVLAIYLIIVSFNYCSLWWKVLIKLPYKKMTYCMYKLWFPKFMFLFFKQFFSLSLTAFEPLRIGRYIWRAKSTCLQTAHIDDVSNANYSILSVQKKKSLKKVVLTIKKPHLIELKQMQYTPQKKMMRYEKPRIMIYDLEDRFNYALFKWWLCHTGFLVVMKHYNATRENHSTIVGLKINIYDRHYLSMM